MLSQKKQIVRPISYEVQILEKNEDLLIGIVDYMNHVVCKIYEGRNGKQDNYMKLNYELLEKKIALIYDIAKGEFIKSRKKGLNIEDSFIK